MHIFNLTSPLALPHIQPMFYSIHLPPRQLPFPVLPSTFVRILLHTYGTPFGFHRHIFYPFIHSWAILQTSLRLEPCINSQFAEKSCYTCHPYLIFSSLYSFQYEFLILYFCTPLNIFASHNVNVVSITNNMLLILPVCLPKPNLVSPCKKWMTWKTRS